MTPELLESLSRLHTGDLPAEEAAALRARVNQDPSLQAVLDAFATLDGDLQRRPTTPTPPATLDAAVVRSLSSPWPARASPRAAPR